MKNLIPHIPKVVSYFFILLFCYAGISKAIDFENFQVQIAQSPLLSAYAGVVSYAVIVLELVIVVLLIFPKSNLSGLYSSTALMSAFTFYIYLILNYSDFVPCSCGGILEKLGWREHLIFNIFCVISGIIGILIDLHLKQQSNKRSLFWFSLTNIVSIGTVVMMFLSSEHLIKTENAFQRRYLLNPITETKNITLDNQSYYFAGEDKGGIYLGNRTYPLSITTTDTDLSQLSTRYVKLNPSTYDFKNISLKVKGSNLYIIDGTVPIIYRGGMEADTAQVISFHDAYFNNISIIDSTSFVVRAQSSQTKNFVLGQLDLKKNPKFIMHSDILKKQIDGVFDLDGMLLSDQNQKEILYVHAYRNQFIVMDNQLSIKHKLHTIDTVATAHIKSVTLKDGSRKMGKPPVKINNHSFAHRGLLFIQSLRMGKLESQSTWNKADVIDVYKTDLQMYVGSFYIHRKSGKKLSSFFIKDDSLFTIHENQLTKYKISGLITKYFRKGDAENPD
jgi:hypothetical protein